MKIFQGFRDNEELDALLEAGADEFYTSITETPDIDLRNHYPSEYGLTSTKELREALDILHSNGSALFIAVNDTFYTDVDVLQAHEQILRLREYGVDGIITPSLALLLELQEGAYDGEVCLSTMQPVFNVETYRFFKQFGLSRVVFPEQVGAHEVQEILEDDAMQTEAFFLLSHDCVNIEPYCLFHHQEHKYLTVPPNDDYEHCRTMPEVDTILDTPDGLGKRMVEEGYVSFDRYHINDNANLYDFHRAGLDYLKMGNRPFMLDHKLLVLDIARSLLDMLDDPALTRTDFLERSSVLVRDALARRNIHSIPRMCTWYLKQRNV